MHDCTSCTIILIILMSTTANAYTNIHTKSTQKEKREGLSQIFYISTYEIFETCSVFVIFNSIGLCFILGALHRCSIVSQRHKNNCLYMRLSLVSKPHKIIIVDAFRCDNVKFRLLCCS